MYIMMTRAAKTACAERGFALRRIHHNPSVETEGSQHEDDVRGFSAEVVEVQPDSSPVTSDVEPLGMLLLGIGYETSTAG